MTDAISDNPEIENIEEDDIEPGEGEQLDTALRPESLAQFIGQTETTEKLRLFMDAARGRDEPLDHVLFSGPAGLGKTSLAFLIAREMNGGAPINVSGTTLVKPIDLVGTLTRLQTGDVLFIDEIHRMPPNVEEFLYTAMEDWRIDVQTGDEGTTELRLKRFTLVGATTREGLLTKPLLARFGIRERLKPYETDALATIITANAAKIEVGITPDAAHSVARRCRGTPRIANRILRRLRDIAQVNDLKQIDRKHADAGLSLLGIDQNGLDEMDIRILRSLERSNRPLGIKTLGVQVGEEPNTIEENHEPWLVAKGMIDKTHRGRVITENGRIALAGGLIE